MIDAPMVEDIAASKATLEDVVAWIQRRTTGS
jgi:hypothetical protein